MDEKVIQLSWDEAMQVVELLSRLPYQEAHLILPGIVMKLAEAQESEEIRKEIIN